jgi:chorismate synthase
METVSVKGRHDLCIALRVPVILEAVTAMVLADLFLSEQRIKRVFTINP